MKTNIPTLQFIKDKKPDKKLIIFIGVEGWSKKGGQGDYIRELSEAMSKDGHAVIVVNPYFRQPHADISNKKGKPLFSLELPIGQGSLPFKIYHNRIGKVHYLRFKDPQEILFPVVYPDWYVEGSLYSDSIYGYIEAVVLSRICMHIVKELAIKPDILHFNDWQAGYGPAYTEIIYRNHNEFKSLFRRTGTIITAHNIAYQGLTKWGLFINKNDPICRLLEKIYPKNGLFIGAYDHGYIYEIDAFGITGLPRHFQFMTDGGAECWSDVPGYGGRHNILKFGLEIANKIVAVSKGNFQDMQRDDLGFGLGGIIAKRAAQGAVDFVWNGVDVQNVGPKNSKELNEVVDKAKGLHFSHFDAEDQNLLEKRAGNKIAVRAKINRLAKTDPEHCFGYLDETGKDDMLVSAISRLVRQKGYGILFENLHYNYELGIHHGERLIDVMMRLRGVKENRLQLVVMATPGDGDGAWVMEQLKGLARQYPGQVSFICKFEPTLANQIRSGSDIFFMPSQYEPGGISNIQAAIMGALCIITYTGGLVDFLENGGTYFDFVAAGFGYNVPWTLKQTGRDFARAFMIALNMYEENKSQWQGLVKRAMGLKVDWSYKVPEYLKIYDAAQSKA